MFCQHICLIYLGGPEFCEKDLKSNYTFGIDVTPVINVTLCGVPAPVVRWRFHGGANAVATRKEINSHTYQYMIQLPNVTQKLCGREITLNFIGKATLERKLHVLLSKCMCNFSFIPLMFINETYFSVKV